MLKISKGATKKLAVRLENADGSARPYDSGDAVVYAISDSRRRSGIILSGTLAYNSETGNYDLELTPAQTETLTEDERYWIDITVQNSAGKFPAVPITEIICVPCNSTGVSLT